MGLVSLQNKEARACSPPCKDTAGVKTQQEGSPLQTRKKVFTRQEICWHLDLDLLAPSLQNCEKQMFVVFI